MINEVLLSDAYGIDLAFLLIWILNIYHMISERISTMELKHNLNCRAQVKRMMEFIGLTFVTRNDIMRKEGLKAIRSWSLAGSLKYC